MGWLGRDVISIKDFSKEELLELLDRSLEIEEDRSRFSQLLKGKVMAALFFEPSTRTRLSFEAAMNYLGGGVIGFSEPARTSIAKGETFEDTIRVVDGYCDVIVMRHPKNGSAQKAAWLAKKPVINGGDGTHEHPTQTMFDLYTIRKNCADMHNLNVGFVGDLKNGRTVHSLSYALSHFRPTFYFVSPKSLGLPENYMKELERKGVECHEDEDLLNVSGKLDILYVTRIQKERFLNPEEYKSVKGVYQLKPSFLKHTKPSLKIMHPLPRVDELDPELDELPQSIYFQQAHNALPVRAALLAMILSSNGNKNAFK